MKITFYFIIVLLLASCKYSDKENLMSNDVDSLLYVKKSTYEEDLSNIRSEMNLKIDSLKKLLEQNPTFENKPFHIIVGTFSVESNAINYTQKIQKMGFEGNTIVMRNGYKMVTAKSYNNLRNTLSDLENIRAAITENAWIYISK